MFRTELTIAAATIQLPRTARVLTVGSCFADSIGSRLAANKVDALINPFGTVFQPLALTKLLRAAAGEDVDWQQHLVEARGRWQSYDLHGSIGADSPVELLQLIQELVRRTGEFLRQADLMLLTLGTAWAYRLRETGELVSNCHKQSADLFVRELLTPDEIINNLAETHAYLRRINPEVRFILTVSPVRHLKDTLPLNAVSKSVLRLATHIVSDLLPGVAYFPAYELLVDDLRDYRFYASDMLHPSEVAEDYIWDKFARTYFDTDFGRFRKDWASVRQSLGHRPLHAGAPEHRQFLESTREKLEQLSLRKVDVTDELNEVHTQLAALPVPRQPVPVAIPEDDEERIDIGEGSAATELTETAAQPANVQPALAEERQPRLSPEEFRAQRAARSGQPERGRRDGRGKGQRELPSENEQFQTAAPSSEEQAQIPSLSNSTASITSLERAEPLAEPAAVPTNADLSAAEGEDPAKKKKRRSRGGAKRTARKNALRLAAGEVLPETSAGVLSAEMGAAGASVATNETLDAPAQSAPQERSKSSVITKSVPVKRGGRRNEPGRVPRVELFAAAPEAPGAANLQLTTNTEPPAAAAIAGSLPVAEVVVALVDPRNNRNRNNRGAAKGEARNAPAPISNATPESTGIIANSVRERVEPLPATTPAAAVVGRDERGNPAAAPTTPAPAGAAKKSNRAKRMVSAARSEKPAIDVPVVPVQDVQLRTQVAAGRLTGTSASLVAPSAPAKKTVATTKPVAVKKAIVARVAAVAKPAPAPVIAVVPAVVASVASVPKPKAKPKVASLKAVQPVAAATKGIVAKPVVAAKTKGPAAAKAVPAVAKAAAAAHVPATPKAKPTAKSVAPKLAEAKPAATKLAATKPVAVKPAMVRAVAVVKPAKPAAVKPAAVKPVAAKPAVPKSKAPGKPGKTA